jgi:hypothetical protein
LQTLRGTTICLPPLSAAQSSSTWLSALVTDEGICESEQ